MGVSINNIEIWQELNFESSYFYSRKTKIINLSFSFSKRLGPSKSTISKIHVNDTTVQARTQEAMMVQQRRIVYLRDF